MGAFVTVVTYVAYLLLSIGLTVWVARTLSRAGRVFLADVFHGNEKLGEAVNHLLVVGFYLVNLGFVALWLRGGNRSVADTQQVFEALSYKVGTVLLVLGLLHLVNVYVLNRFRRGGQLRREQRPSAPVPPHGWTPPAPPAPPVAPAH
jgi:heme/copper-type cytochrome/quinol oxidase subunit 1